MPTQGPLSRWTAILLAWMVLVACSDDEPPEAGADPERSEASSAKEMPAVTGAPSEHAHTNRLIDETSPYLLQHAHNPVDWYPWGPEALAKAKEENKPIFLSIGYSACHWCHVMERESFESEEIAAVMNEHFISVKVDREERPDIDEIYMTAVQAMTGSGGWPMSVFLTPDLKPFYGGTYFPPQDAFGRPGFKSLLTRLAEVWESRRDEVLASAESLTQHVQQALGSSTTQAGTLSAELIAVAAGQLGATFDSAHGGFGEAPKFPSAPSIALLLREHHGAGEERLLMMATHTLDKMAQGGMYDHLGGGFARYSTDEEWLVPHFEKMLYDNAQLVPVYLEAYQVTKSPFYRDVARETLEYVLRDMRDERGGFYSSEDADSEGEEGKFYIWRHDEIVEHLGKADAKVFTAYYSVRPKGNFQSREHYHAEMNILHTPRPEEAVADELGLSLEALREKMHELDTKMLEIRSQRIRPGLDDKILTSWNALMISAFAQGYQVIGDTRYRDAAVEAANFIMDEMTVDGQLLRTHRKGESRLPAYLDDYAFTVVAFADVYEATFDPRWLESAADLADTMLDKFWDTESPGLYFTSEDHKNLIVRARSAQDGAIPSGSSVAAYGMLRLAKFLDRSDYYEKARALLEAHQAHMEQAPRGFLKMLVAVDFLVHPPKEIAIAGPTGSEEVRGLLDTVHSTFIPNKVVAFVDPALDSAAELGEVMPLLAAKTLIDGKAAAYVCKDFACKKPVTAPEDLTVQLVEETGEV